MKEKETVIKIHDTEYKFTFNLNVMQEIQMEYKTLQNWGELTSDTTPEGEKKEPDLKALIYGIKAMINEGIDIDNENSEIKRGFLTDRQVGRIITEVGIQNITNQIQRTIVNSTEDDKPKNE